MDYDVAIIGAGMSGLAAGIRLAYFGKRVCILERHYAYGGLNSYYKLGGRAFDVGLHAVTNYVPPGTPRAPLTKLLRQLRISRDELDLRPQRFSEIRFPGCRLRFSNDPELLQAEVAAAFPSESDRFRAFVEELRAFDDTRLDQPDQSTRAVLRDRFPDPLLIEMLLCGPMYYGCAREHDMDFASFVTMFKSIFLEGFARPREGVRTIIRALVRKFHANGGRIRMRCGVKTIVVEGGRVRELVLDGGERITASVVLSSAGHLETMRLCGDERLTGGAGPGRLSFVEAMAVLDELPHRLGHEATIVFFNDGESFTYEVPPVPVDLRSGVICCPSNYEGHEDMAEGLFRVTWLANYDQWAVMDEATYVRTKEAYFENFLARASECVPEIRGHIVARDLFTPRTVEQYTGHVNGAVYGAPHKVRDGRTPIENLFLCGTDQGFLGITGAMLSGITIANMHVLEAE